MNKITISFLFFILFLFSNYSFSQNTSKIIRELNLHNLKGKKDNPISKDNLVFLEVLQDNNTIEITFTDKEINENNITKLSNLVSTKFKDKGIKPCCHPIRKIDDCTLACCDGRQIKSCNEKLLQACEIVWR